MSHRYFKTKKLKKGDADVPKCNKTHKVLHIFIDDDMAYVVTAGDAPNGHKGEATTSDLVVFSHLNWWALHPEDDPGWQEPTE